LYFETWFGNEETLKPAGGGGTGRDEKNNIWWRLSSLQYDAHGESGEQWRRIYGWSIRC